MSITGRNTSKQVERGMLGFMKCSLNMRYGSLQLVLTMKISFLLVKK